MVTINDDEMSFYLPEHCDLSSAARIHAALVDRLSGSAITVDAEHVERCGTPVAQILLATAKELAEHGGKLTVRNATPAFRKCFEDLGLAQEAQTWE